MASGFIKKLFGSSSPNKPKIPKELSGLLDKLQQDIFPDGPGQMQKEIVELSSILGVPASRIKGTFTYACSRAFMGNCDKETLMFGINRHDEALSQNQVEKFAKYIFTKLLKQRTGLPEGPFLESSLSAMGFMSDDNGGLTYDEIPGGYGEFGLSINNPVPVNGILSSDKYLGRLKTIDGLDITWNRVGSGGADNIDNPIDIYKIKDSNGMDRQTIYISPYHPSTSKKAPRGYRFK